jgi:hypothetical protein
VSPRGGKFVGGEGASGDFLLGEREEELTPTPLHDRRPHARDSVARRRSSVCPTEKRIGRSDSKTDTPTGGLVASSP